MVRILATGVALALLGAVTAMANPMKDVCRAKARQITGYKGSPPKAEARSGNMTFRLGGSAAVGVSRESGRPTPRAPAGSGYGAAEQERQQRKYEQKHDRAAANYQRIYDDCMRDR